MNVEIGTEAAQFPEKKNIKGIFVAVHIKKLYNFYFFSYATLSAFFHLSFVLLL